VTALLVANMKTEEIVGDLAGMPADERKFAGCGAQRLLWFARDGAVIVMPRMPDDAVLDYVTTLTGTRRSTLRVVVPESGRFGPDILSRDRLLSRSCMDGVGTALDGRTADTIVAMCGDGTVATLARELGITSALPGYGLAAAGGVALVNAKSMFRAVAGGVGAPMAPGWSGGDQAGACHFISEELAAGHCVIVKQDLQSGGKGNVVLSAVPDVRVAGTKLPPVVLPGAVDVAAYLDRRWGWLTDKGRHSIVIERYFADAVPLFAEFFIDDAGIRLTGYGEMLMTPTYAGVIAPMARLDPAVEEDFIETAKRVCVPFRAMGYRGTASVDALLTAGNRFWLSEINCRMGGSSHLHSVIGAHVIGPSHRAERLIAERDGWRVPSFREAVHRLESAGLAYDPETRLGVILTCDVTPANGTVKCCVVAEDMDAVKKYETLLRSVFSRYDTETPETKQ
jgi:Pre ATP-grasp domain/PGM1 C-terminal domain